MAGFMYETEYTASFKKRDYRTILEKCAEAFPTAVFEVVEGTKPIKVVGLTAVRDAMSHYPKSVTVHTPNFNFEITKGFIRVIGNCIRITEITSAIMEQSARMFDADSYDFVKNRIACVKAATETLKGLLTSCVIVQANGVRCSDTLDEFCAKIQDGTYNNYETIVVVGYYLGFSAYILLDKSKEDCLILCTKNEELLDEMVKEFTAKLNNT